MHMKYAVISDIHGNLPALKAVMDDIKVQKCDRIVCLGDIVGYGLDPAECVEMIRSRAVSCVKGNFDGYCSSEDVLDGFTPKAAQAVERTRALLGEPDREWLRSLELVKEVDGFTIVHSTLEEPQRWGYVFDKIAAASSFKRQETDVCFFGHTHVPVAFIRDTMVRGGTYSKFKVEPGKKYFVNVGSVGQPRDNNPKAAYVIYDKAQQTIELRRVYYEIPYSDGPVGAGVTVKPKTPPKLTGSNAQALPKPESPETQN
jgi:predicted phosphodiesterase